ncbi:MAG: hypothetical protein RIF41_25890 [Polyangiaceae bacterium]
MSSRRRPKRASKQPPRLVPPWEPSLPVGDAVTRRQIVSEADAHRREVPRVGAFDVGLEALTVW